MIGVVLSGALNDGSAGLRAIKQCGGTAVVQHWTDATVGEMPLSAARHAMVDYALPANEIAARELIGMRAEGMLWSLMRAHQERAALARRMAEQERARNHVDLAE